MFLFVLRKTGFRTLFYEAKAFYAEKSSEPDEESIKDWYCARMRQLCRIYVVAYTTLVTMNLLYSIVNRVFLDKRILLFGLDVPFLDEDSSPDYEIVLIYELIQDFYTWVNIVSFQYLFIVLILHNLCLMDILIQKMKRPWKLHSEENWPRLRDILTAHQTQLSFFKRMSSLLDVYNTTQLICTTMNSTVVAYILVFNSSIPGCVLLVLSLGMLLVNCTYGAYTERKAEELVVAAFDYLDWTALQPKERKGVVMLLKSTQNNTKLRCGGIFVVNYHTFLTVRNGNHPHTYSSGNY